MLIQQNKLSCSSVLVALRSVSTDDFPLSLTYMAKSQRSRRERSGLSHCAGLSFTPPFVRFIHDALYGTDDYTRVILHDPVIVGLKHRIFPKR